MDRIEELMRNARPDVTVPPRPSVAPAEIAGGLAAPATSLHAADGTTGTGNGLGVFTDQGRPVSKGLGRGTRRRKVLGTALAGLAAAAVITVGVLAGNLGRPAPGPAPAANTEMTATATPTPSSSASAAAPTDPATVKPPLPSEPVAQTNPAATAPAGAPLPAGWKTYRSSGGKVSFDYPGNWTVVGQSAGASGQVSVQVNDQLGKTIATLTYGGTGGLGGACSAEPVPYTVLDFATVDLPYNPQASNSVTPRFTFRAMEDAGGVIASYGLTSTVGGQGGKACLIYNVVNGPSESPVYMFASTVQMNSGGSGASGAMTFPSLDEARAYMATPEYANAKQMITSLRIAVG